MSLLGRSLARGNEEKNKKRKSNKKRRKHSSRDWSRAETIKTHKSAAKKVAPNQTKKLVQFPQAEDALGSVEARPSRCPEEPPKQVKRYTRDLNT